MQLLHRVLAAVIGAGIVSTSSAARSVPSPPANVQHIQLEPQTDTRDGFALPEHYVLDASGVELIQARRLPQWLSPLTWAKNGPELFDTSGKKVSRFSTSLESLRLRLKDENNAVLPELDLVPAHTVVVQFWADWCAPCILDMREFVKSARNATEPVIWITIDLSAVTL